MSAAAVPVVSAVGAAVETTYSQPKRKMNQEKNAADYEVKRVARQIDEQNAQNDRQAAMYSVRNRRRQVREDIQNTGRMGTILSNNTGAAPAMSGMPFTASKTRLGS